MSNEEEFRIRIKNISIRIKQISIKNTSTMSTYTFIPSVNKRNERHEFSYFVEYKRGFLCITSSSDLRIILNEEECMNFHYPDIKCDISITDMYGNQYDYLGCYVSSPPIILSEFGKNLIELFYSVNDFVYNGCSFKNFAYDSLPNKSQKDEI